MTSIELVAVGTTDRCPFESQRIAGRAIGHGEDGVAGSASAI